MSYEFGDTGSEKHSRSTQIRALFVSGTTVNEHTEKCMREGVWTKNEIRAMAAAKARDEVRDALGQITPEGVPFAGPTLSRKDRAPVWRQMELWSKRDFDYNWTAYTLRVRTNQRIADNIARVCRARFGEDPILVDIPE